MTKIPINVSEGETPADIRPDDVSNASPPVDPGAEQEALDQPASDATNGDETAGDEAMDADASDQATAADAAPHPAVAGAETEPTEDGDDSAAKPEPPQDAVETLREERDRAREQLLRSTADFDNFRRRVRRELEEAKMHGKDEALRELLPIFDNLERAVQAAEGATDITSVIEGVQMVLKLFADTASRMGLKRAPGVGEPFDPAVHEAIQQLETNEHPPGTIVHEVAAGYLFGQRLLRAAMVVVARPTPAKTDDSKGADAPEQSGDGPAEVDGDSPQEGTG